MPNIESKILTDAVSGLSNLEIEANSMSSQTAGGGNAHPDADQLATINKGDFSTFPTANDGRLIRIFSNPTLIQSIHINPAQIGPIQAFSLFIRQLTSNDVFWLCYKRRIDGPTTIIDRDVNLLLGNDPTTGSSYMYFYADMYPMDTEYLNAINFTINCFELS